jgi:predicted permease
MLSTFSVTLPIFALIFAGWFTRRIGVLGPHATSELNRFVVWLALPALLFGIVAKAQWSQIWQPGFIAAFGLSSLCIFALTVAFRLRRPRHLADATIDALNAGYANTGFMGFPLVLVALGQSALALTLTATILTACVLFALAIVLIEVGLQKEQRRMALVRKVGGSLARNPLLVAPAVAFVFPITGLSLPTPAASFINLLGAAASPCALVALGLFIGERRRATRDLRSAGLLTALKLFAQPALAWIFAVPVFHLAPLPAETAILLAALPTGTGPFMLAEFYRREASVTSNVVLASTIGSVLTVTAYLALAR